MSLAGWKKRDELDKNKALINCPSQNLALQSPTCSVRDCSQRSDRNSNSSLRAVRGLSNSKAGSLGWTYAIKCRPAVPAGRDTDPPRWDVKLWPECFLKSSRCDGHRMSRRGEAQHHVCAAAHVHEDVAQRDRTQATHRGAQSGQKVVDACKADGRFLWSSTHERVFAEYFPGH